MLTTTNQRLKLDSEVREYMEYVWLVGFKIGKAKRLPNPTEVLIKSASTSISYGDIDFGRKHTTEQRAEAYLRFGNHQSIFL